MNKEKLEEKYKAKDLTPLKVKSILSINHSPHPFTIGSKHVAFASDKYGGMLGDSAINNPDFPPCAARGCSLSYDEHTYNTVLVLELTKDANNKEVQAVLESINEEIESDKLDGYVFIENEFNFITGEPNESNTDTNGTDV